MVRDLWAHPKRGAAPLADGPERRSRVALTISWMAATLAIALFVPDIGKVIELIGGISAFFIFIFPGRRRRRGGRKGVGCGVNFGPVPAGLVPVVVLSIRAGGRAVPGVHDGEPKHRAAQKVSV